MMNLTARRDVSCTLYSSGVEGGLISSDSSELARMAAIRLLRSSPVVIIAPMSKASGRSMRVLKVTAGKASMDDSSEMVPESDRTHLAPNCKRLKSWNPKGSWNVMPSVSAQP